MNRRDMLKTAGSAAAISVLGGIPLNLSAKDKVSRRNRKKIMVIGAHPDDPETAAGGTMCPPCGAWINCLNLNQKNL